VQHELGRAPQPGDAIEVPGFRLTAVEIRDGRIRRLRGEPVVSEEPGEEVTG